MLLSTWVVIAGTVAVGTRTWHNSYQAKKAEEGPFFEDDTQKAAQQKNKPRFSLYKKITVFNQALRLDELLSSSRSTKSSFFRPHLSPWEKPLHQQQKAEMSENAESHHSINEHSIGEDLRLFRRYVSKYWRPYWGMGLLGGACLLSFGIYETAFAYTLKVLVDGVTGVAVVSMTGLLGKLLIGFPVVMLMVIAGERIVARLGSRVVQDIHYDIFEYLQNLSLSFHKQEKLGDILARFSTDMPFVRLGMATLIPTMADALVIGMNIAFLWWLEWHIALVSLLSMPLIIYVLQEFSPHASEANFALKNQEASMIHAVQEGMRAQPMVKSFSIASFLQDSFLQELSQLEVATTEAVFSRAIFERSSVIALFSSQLLSISAGVVLIGGGYMSVGALVSFIMIQSLMYSNIRKLSQTRLQLLIMAAVGLRRVDLLLQQQIEIVDAPDALDLLPFHHTIQFEHVSFSYTGKYNQLDCTSFTIEAGQFVAFVGPSGAGKSTILNLMLRFYDVCEGRVTIDGHDIRDVTQASLRAQLAIVPQEPFIFNASILDNIRIVKPDASMKEIIAATRAAELHDFIMRLPEGYHNMAGETGGHLSGGQQQRIAIARAMLCDPAILILDEATRNLDADTAAMIDATIRELAKDRTVISISHDLSFVTNADQIFVLDEGRLVEQGRHHELLEQYGLYAQMWQRQARSQLYI